ncbi:MAG: rhodanese-like domain-containing protein [Paenalcaligenes sp.]
MYSEAKISVVVLRQWLGDGNELALLDVREHGQYGAGHLFYAVNVPYSQLEYRVAQLVPRVGARVVLYDQEDGVAKQAQQRLCAMGYTQVFVLEGGLPAWQASGHNVFEGVNVLSKTFGELVELQCKTPHVKATDLAASQAAEEPLLLVDGRPWEEYQKKTIPGAVCCPNGELALRVSTLLEQAEATRVVVNCAGRTRSIIGAQTLINLGVPYEVVALENGTQGWYLAGLALELGAMRHGEIVQPDMAELPSLQQQAQKLAKQVGVPQVLGVQLQRWLTDSTRTTYLCDVRTAAEFQKSTLLGAVHTPGGQLVQATDQYLGVRGARVVVWDDAGVRAWVTASWLHQMGWEVYVLGAEVAALARVSSKAVCEVSNLLTMDATQLADAIQNHSVQVVDIRSSYHFRAGHIKQAQWSIRPRLRCAVLQTNKPVVLVADDAQTAHLATQELAGMGIQQVYWHKGVPTEWCEAGLSVEVSPNQPTDAQCIDYVFFAHDRHEGNKQAAQQYLAWETNLLKQVDSLELQYFKVYVAPC